jgi:hypothetical protein
LGAPICLGTTMVSEYPSHGRLPDYGLVVDA